MKQQLWIINSSLLSILVVFVVTSYLLQQDIPRIKRVTQIDEESPTVAMEQTKVDLEFFTQNDLFSPAEPAKVASVSAVEPSLIPPIPEFKSPNIPTPPEIKKPEFIDPLSLTLNGIIIGSDELLSTVIIVDDTSKEAMYHLGDKIKDGTIVKISRNKIVIFRANGQQEVFSLRKDAILPPGTTVGKPWERIAKKNDDDTYQIDPNEFATQVHSLGQFLELFTLLPTYNKGKQVGIKIIKINIEDASNLMGIEEGDVITKINEFTAQDLENRMKIYDSIMQLKANDTLKITLMRKDETKTITYKIGRINRASKYAFLHGDKGSDDKEKSNDSSTKPDGFKLSPLQERTQQIKDFDNRHKQRYDDSIADIRKRLLDNMKVHAPNVRVR